MIRKFMFLILLLPTFVAANPVSDSSSLVLRYRQPAQEWVEALPIGNGHLGAMVYGGVDAEEIQLNEGTFWGGGPHRNDGQHALENLDRVRQLIFDGKNGEAQHLMERTFMTGRNGMPYQTLGSLFIENLTPTEGVTDYERTLHLDDASARVQWSDGQGIRYSREVIASLPERVIAIRLTASQARRLNFRLRFASPIDIQRSHKGKSLIMAGMGRDHEGVKGVVRMHTEASVRLTDGRQQLTDSTLTVVGATEAVVYIVAATNFVNYLDVSADAAKRAQTLMKKASAQDWNQLHSAHVASYQHYFNRVHLRLGGSPAEVDTMQTHHRIQRFSEGRTDPALVALLFNYGRYLLISCSQPGGQAAGLQGLWNKELLAPWDGKYTININTEMNYWPAEVCNLSEMAEPLFNLINDLSHTGQQTAQTMYGARGWVAHHNTDIWRSTGMVDAPAWGAWPMGGAWLTTHLWEHWLFTGDRDFLASAYPAMRGAAEFLLTFMVRHPKYGWLVTCPSMSPEHGPESGIYGGASVCAGPTMDTQIAHDVFAQTIAAAGELSIDAAFADSLRKALDALPPMQIGRYGQLQEWLEDVDAVDDHHRHVSHVYGLYPSHQITALQTPDVFRACRASLQFRGDDATGWSIGWKLNLWARLLDGDHAYTMIRALLNLLPNDRQTRRFPAGRIYPNLFDAHPPFQIDGNFGFTAGVAEMLVQSHEGFIRLLPALPVYWPEGEVNGLRARGGFEISLSWAKGKLTHATVKSLLGRECRILVGNTVRTFPTTKGESYDVSL